MGTIQTRLTSDNRQHDEAFRKSRQEIYNYNKRVDESKESVLKFAKKGLGGLSMALGAAGGAMAIFNKLLENSNSLADKYGESMQVAKSGVNAFFQGVMDFVKSGEFTTFNEFLKNGGKYAKQFYDSMDSYNTQKTWNQGIYADLEANMAKQRAIIDDVTKSEKERVAAQKELNRLTEEFGKIAKTTSDKAKNELYDYIRNVGQYNFNDKSMKWIIQSLYTGSLPDTIKKLREQADVMTNVPGRINLTGAADKTRQADALQRIYNALSDDKGLEELVKKWREASEAMEYYYNTLKKNNKSSNKSIGSGSSSSSKSINPADLEKWEINNPISDPTPNAIFGVGSVYGNNLNDSWIGDIEKKEWDLEQAAKAANAELQKQANIFDLQIDTLGSLSSAFSTLGDSFDMPGLNIVGIVGEAIANIVKGYATASAQSATLGPWAWAAFSAAGLAQVAAVISQIHSLTGYANGGIVGGNSFSGDRVMARVNSGEMILNRSQQANLFNMIGGGVTTGGNVKFRIEGDALVGVLNNYNKKTGRVR